MARLVYLYSAEASKRFMCIFPSQFGFQVATGAAVIGARESGRLSVAGFACGQTKVSERV